MSSSPPAPRERWSAYAVDAFGALFALVYGAPSLLYPLAPDQSLFFYVGRLWLHGGLPYRDAFDQKPPGIFALYALVTAVLGPHPWAIHTVELLGVLVAGWLVARIVSDGRPRPGVFGLACTCVSFVYFTSFDYWSTGQVEYWQSLFSLASVATVLRSEKPDRRAFAGGVFAGLATVFKPSLPLLLAVLVCAARATHGAVLRRDHALKSLRALVLYGVGAMLVVGLLLLPFAIARSGLSAMRDCILGFNRLYTVNWTEPFNMNWLRVGPCVVATWTIALVAFGHGVNARRRDELRIGWLSLGLLVLAIATVAAQRKYFDYHWVITAPFAALVMAWGWTVIASARFATLATAASITCFVLAGTRSTVGYHSIYSHHVKATVRLLRGELSREAFNGSFGGPFGNDYGVLEHLGDTVRERARPGDTLCVRGYMPAVYVVSGLRCPSRFPWEQHLGAVWQPPFATYTAGDPRTGWIAQHREALQREPPTFVVTFDTWPADRNALREQGYREISSLAGHVLYERRR